MARKGAQGRGPRAKIPIDVKDDSGTCFQSINSQNHHCFYNTSIIIQMMDKVF